MDPAPVREESMTADTRVAEIAFALGLTPNTVHTDNIEANRDPWCRFVDVLDSLGLLEAEKVVLHDNSMVWELVTVGETIFTGPILNPPCTPASDKLVPRVLSTRPVAVRIAESIGETPIAKVAENVVPLRRDAAGSSVTGFVPTGGEAA